MVWDLTFRSIPKILLKYYKNILKFQKSIDYIYIYIYNSSARAK